MTPGTLYAIAKGEVAKPRNATLQVLAHYLSGGKESYAAEAVE